MPDPRAKKSIPLARKTPLLDFAKLCYPQYEKRSYLTGLTRLLELQREYFLTKGKRGIQYVSISMPRRRGKTELAKINAALFLASFPAEQTQYITYGGKFSNDNSMDIRNYTQVPRVRQRFQHLELAPDNKGKVTWGLKNHRGGLHSAGIMGELTGRGWSLLILDDLIKNLEQALNRGYCEKIWQALESTVFNAPNRKYAAIISIGTRWTTYDPIGRMLAGEAGHDFFDYTLPALTEDDILLKHGDEVIYERPAGESTWPEQWSVPELLEKKNTTASLRLAVASWHGWRGH